MLLTECIDSFGLAMASHGLEIADNALIIADGELHRFTVKGDKPNSKNGWFILFDGAVPAGSFGSWKLGIAENWCAKSKLDMNSRERREHHARMAQARNKRALDQRKQQHQAAIQCGELWSKASPAVNPEHSYLAAKQITACGLRQLNELLLVPIQNALGQLVNLQFIAPDGTKRFKSGGMIKGCYMMIGKLTQSAYVCEGYSTGVSIHQATGQAVAVAFSAGNLLPVARVLRNANPDIPMIIAADNDHQSAVNVGLLKACEAAKAVNALVCWPPNIDGVSDFNDLASLAGLAGVTELLALKEVV